MKLRAICAAVRRIVVWIDGYRFCLPLRYISPYIKHVKQAAYSMLRAPLLIDCGRGKTAGMQLQGESRSRTVILILKARNAADACSRSRPTGLYALPTPVLCLLDRTPNISLGLASKTRLESGLDVKPEGTNLLIERPLNPCV